MTDINVNLGNYSNNNQVLTLHSDYFAADILLLVFQEHLQITEIWKATALT